MLGHYPRTHLWGTAVDAAAAAFVAALVAALVASALAAVVAAAAAAIVAVAGVAGAVATLIVPYSSGTKLEMHRGHMFLSPLRHLPPSSFWVREFVLRWHGTFLARRRSSRVTKTLARKTLARLQTARLQAASCKVAGRKAAGDRLPTARLQAPGKSKNRYASRAPALPASLIRCILCSPFLAVPYNKSYKVQGRRGAKQPPPSFAPPRTPPLSSRLTSISETSHTPAEVSADLRVDEWLNQKSARQTN